MAEGGAGESDPFFGTPPPSYDAYGRSSDQDIEMREEVVFDDIEMSEEFVFDACCNCGPNGDCSDCKCSTHRCTFCHSQNCLFRKQIQNAIESMSEEQTRGALYKFMTVKGIENLNQAVFGEGIKPQVDIKGACPECKKYCKYVSKCIGKKCKYRESVEKKIQNMKANERKEALKTILDSNSRLDKVRHAVFRNVCNDKVPTWYCLRKCCNCRRKENEGCTCCRHSGISCPNPNCKFRNDIQPCWNCQRNGNYRDCNCCRHIGTSCPNTNCKFREDIQNAINSMRREQTRDALNELMAVRGIEKLNQAVVGHEFSEVYNTRACSKCQTSRKYDSACSDVACTYKKELEKAIQRMDADKGKTALNEVLKSNSLNKVEDAVFWNVCNDRVPEWYSEENKHIQDENEFKHNANDFAHFAVDRKGKYKHHFFTLRPNSETVTIVQYSDALFNHFFGIGEVQSANFKFTEQELNSVVDFKGERCFRIRHNENSLKTEMERYGRMIGKMEERFYNVHFNNCEHFVNYVLDGKVSAPMTNEQRKKATFWDIILSELKSVGLLVTFVIALAGITLGSIERQSYVRIFIAALISFERQDNLDVCTSHIGKHIIQNARDRLEIDMYKDPETFDGDLIKNMSRYLDSPLVCDKAQQLGYRVLFKSSIYFLLVGFMLQTAIILTYNYMHLKPMRRMCLQQRKLYLYRKYLYREVFGGYAPILFTVTYGGVLQYMSSLPPTAHYLALCLFAVICRFIVLTIIECIFCKFRGRLDKVLATIIIIFLIIIFIICIFFHYYAHAKFDPF